MALTLGTYALGYLGDPFFPGARRVAALTSAANAPVTKWYRRKFKTIVSPGLQSPLLFNLYWVAPFAMLAYAPLTLTLPFALTTYFFVAHTLGAPQYALWVTLGRGVTALAGLFCMVQQAGQKWRPEVFYVVGPIVSHSSIGF